MDKKRFKELIELNEWREAKSYRETHPHSYCVKKNFKPQSEWNSFINYIWDNATVQKWYHLTFLYLVFEESIFFTIEAPLHSTLEWANENCDLINRASIWSPSGWNEIKMPSGEVFYKLPRPHVSNEALRNGIKNSDFFIGKTQCVVKNGLAFYITRKSGVVCTKPATLSEYYSKKK